MVTRTSTTPAAAAAGAVAVQPVSVHETAVAFPAAPKLTAVAPFRPVPVMVTFVPPACGPLAGLTPVTTGTGSGKPSTVTAFAAKSAR